ncbi:proline-rich proteoglycan 2-like [Leptopilina boulardi]|uniref:proline-rich proteoglycan 2-like n=1 Tax=Leptopilina boulardi TaxID=63433 RepID=UPI0021F65FEE|nr:proline-rich proteoglycan 2-like [Leptopilina boulardi]
MENIQYDPEEPALFLRASEQGRDIPQAAPRLTVTQIAARPDSPQPVQEPGPWSRTQTHPQQPTLMTRSINNTAAQEVSMPQVENYPAAAPRRRIAHVPQPAPRPPQPASRPVPRRPPQPAPRRPPQPAPRRPPQPAPRRQPQPAPRRPPQPTPRRQPQPAPRRAIEIAARPLKSTAQQRLTKAMRAMVTASTRNRR